MDTNAKVEREDQAPIKTKDGAEIAKGMTLYQINAEYWVGAKSISKLTVVALSKVNRYFITSCEQGCETKHRLVDFSCSQGGPSLPYASLEKAKVEATKMRQEKVAQLRKEAQNSLDKAKELEQLGNDFTLV